MSGTVLKTIQFPEQWGVDHVDTMILIVIRDDWMTKQLTTKQVPVDTDYRHFVTFWFGGYVIKPARKTTKIIVAIWSTPYCTGNWTPFGSKMSRHVLRNNAPISLWVKTAHNNTVTHWHHIQFVTFTLRGYVSQPARVSFTVIAATWSTPQWTGNWIAFNNMPNIYVKYEFK